MKLIIHASLWEVADQVWLVKTVTLAITFSQEIIFLHIAHVVYSLLSWSFMGYHINYSPSELELKVLKTSTWAITFNPKQMGILYFTFIFLVARTFAHYEIWAFDLVILFSYGCLPATIVVFWQVLLLVPFFPMWPQSLTYIWKVIIVGKRDIELSYFCTFLV